jgi:hypothetical protein
MKNRCSPQLFLAIPFCLIVILILCFSCAEKDKSNSPEEILVADLKNTDLNMREWNLDTRILFKYKNQTEALERTDKLINTIIDKMKNDLFSPRVDDRTNIITEINLINGDAFLTEIYILNADSHQVFEGGALTLDEDDFKHLSDLEWEAIRKTTACPKGYTRIASCDTNIMPRNLTEPLSNYLAPHLNSGKDIKIQINVGVVETAICLKIPQ